MIRVQGEIVHKGLSIGPIRFLRPPRSGEFRRHGANPREERRRFEIARDRAIVELRRLQAKVAAHLGDSEALIFLVQSMMLEDEEYLRSIDTYIDEAATAEYAVAQAGAELVALFASLESSYMRARAADAVDLSRRLEGILSGKYDWLHLRQNASILVGEEITPSDAAMMDRGKLLGLVSQDGSPESHTAILAGSMGIPALTGVRVDPRWDGHTAILDGDSGCLIVDPNAETLRSFQPRVRHTLDTMVRKELSIPCHSLPGRTLSLTAVVRSSWEAADAYMEGAGGIGLYVPEHLFGDRKLPPDEEEQFTEYRETLYAMRGRPVTIQMMNYFGPHRELLLLPGWHWSLLRTQIRAILRASAHGPVSIALPGAESGRGVMTGRQLLNLCRRELKAEGVSCEPVSLGALVQSPSAVLHIDKLAEEADFLILSGHDLLRSTASGDGAGDYPAVLWMIRRAAAAGRKHGCKIVLTGELDQYPHVLQTIVNAGIDEFAISAHALSTMRSFIEDSGEEGA